MQTGSSSNQSTVSGSQSPFCIYEITGKKPPQYLSMKLQRKLQNQNALRGSIGSQHNPKPNM
jgi:hypothetical protein